MDFTPALRRSFLALERRSTLECGRSRCAFLHTSNARYANPIPFPTTAEPPPPPPEPATAAPDDRLDRKRKQAELLQKGRELRANPSRPATVLQKRFWKEVSVNETPGMPLTIKYRLYQCLFGCRWSTDPARQAPCPDTAETCPRNPFEQASTCHRGCIGMGPARQRTTSFEAALCSSNIFDITGYGHSGSRWTRKFKSSR